MHDIVEDTEVTTGMILDEFGWRIAEIVDRLTRDRPDGTKLSVDEVMKNIYLHKDKETLLVKLIDRLHNVQTIEHMSKKKQLLTSKKTLQRFLIAAYELEMPDIANLIYNMFFQLNIKLGLINKSPTYNDNLFIQKSILPDLIFQNDLH